MKKIFTLVFSIALLSTAFAQYGQKGQQEKDRGNDVYASNDSRGHGNHNDGYGSGYDKRGHGNNGWYVFTPRERDMQIADINHDYDHKIRDVKFNRFMGWFQKDRQIRFLEAQRDQETNAVMYRFNHPKNKFGDFGKRKNNRW